MRCSLLSILLRMRMFFGVTSTNSVVRYKLEALLKAEYAVGGQAEGVVAAGCSHVGNVLLLADVYDYILIAGAFAHYLAHVYGYARAYEHAAAILSVKEAVAVGLAGLGADKAAVGTLLDISLIRLILVEYAAHYAVAPGYRSAARCGSPRRPLVGMWNSSLTLVPLGSDIISIISALRRPSFSITAPT